MIIRQVSAALLAGVLAAAAVAVSAQQHSPQRQAHPKQGRPDDDVTRPRIHPGPPIQHRQRRHGETAQNKRHRQNCNRAHARKQFSI